MLSINLQGKIVFIAGIGDDQGYGWAIAKALQEAGARIILGVWPPIYKLFTLALQNGKFDESRKLSDGTLLKFEKIYPLDASFDHIDDVPEEIRENKRYKALSHYTISDVAQAIEQDFGSIDFVVHSLANAPEIQKSLLETSRKGYLSAISTSTYSQISLLKHLSPLMNAGGAALSLSYLAAQRAIPGYGGGMSSAKAALESDTKTLAWELGREKNIRINAISAGPLKSRAARAIGFIDEMIAYTKANAPITSSLESTEIGYLAAFLLSPLASSITGSVIYADKGMHAMGVSVNDQTFAKEEISHQLSGVKE